MNYEEKYKEALEDMRVIYPNLKGDAKLAVEHAFPELAESEDERIRKELKEAFEAYDIESSWNGIPIRSILAWIEKQKEPKHATDSKSERVIKAARSVLNNWLDGTDCPDVSGDFAELEYAIREYDGDDKQKPLRNLEIPAENESVVETADSELEKELNAFLCGYDREINEEEIATLTNVAEHFYQLGKQEQKPVEWSEEDEKKITFLERLIRYNVPEGQYGWADGHKSGFITKSEAISKLKSLRPQKLDASKLENFDPVDVLHRIKKEWPMAWEKVVWKPTEEQMKALLDCTIGNEYDVHTLVRLWAELKKLM